ncbi:hypothetical protein PC110_g2150 [Phytophthora cactorum]|uniref:Uncharacterized protein n=1 Tax=Phytophthora cactorum TaxID=29920 RepID=A0A329SXM0_9STRA|nr:hypothetical protein PC112_g13976 [Phytophthora cactorum]KAG3057248.1 hypothetical protein PC122_g21097 [Phytophthora cactorum]KAG3057992.1 hypothetical protein PC121_g14581 [Phytophthora cactorum]RAW41627.1 hypothetical protein PC110_g2150 [Phytophthora cactorum]
MVLIAVAMALLAFLAPGAVLVSVLHKGTPSRFGCLSANIFG